ncbi:stage II sporulation protein M [Actinomyces gaoshouyii]|uniref:stage II sporulation protein M n=1 Tax=Actinomyces gaoshouyii TaxID=1960083 RepID=UPI001F0A25B7|nr:stage II sporulation protein M [Actinomyces gaoshouyii]
MLLTVDIDAFTAAHRDEWERLDALAAKRRLSGAQADELVILYRITAQHLSRLRTTAPDPQLIAEMSARVARARGRITGPREIRVRDITRFLTQTIPLALYRARWWAIGVGTAFTAIAVVVGLWTLRSPEAMGALGTPGALDRYADQSFEDYYSTYDSHEFSALVWTNNARIAAICIGAGITGVVPAFLVLINAMALGRSGAVMADHDRFLHFLALIIPHGLLELTCVFFAGGVGLRLFWALLAPGPRSRGRALAEDGRLLITAAVGLTGALAIAGLLEGFVTAARIPWLLKAALGLLALAVLWAAVLVLGRRAERALAGGDDVVRVDEMGYAASEAG